eukprot:442051-Rhodomonas_salina.4
MQENAFLVQMVRRLCFLVFDFAVYAMSGTDIPYRTICLRACYAMPVAVTEAMHFFFSRC